MRTFVLVAVLLVGAAVADNAMDLEKTKKAKLNTVLEQEMEGLDETLRVMENNLSTMKAEVAAVHKDMALVLEENKHAKESADMPTTTLDEAPKDTNDAPEEANDTAAKDSADDSKDSADASNEDDVAQVEDNNNNDSNDNNSEDAPAAEANTEDYKEDNKDEAKDDKQMEEQSNENESNDSEDKAVATEDNNDEGEKEEVEKPKAEKHHHHHKDSHKDKKAHSAKKSSHSKHHEEESEEAADVALLQMGNGVGGADVDHMNDGVEDDDSSAPNMRRSLALAQMRASEDNAEDEREKKYTFGLKSDGSGDTFDIHDGQPLPPPVPRVTADQGKPNDVNYRVAPNDPEFANVPTADIDPEETISTYGMPGTWGKAVAMKGEDNDTNATGHDVVCVCKRQGAPRGFDRIKCKRHPTPTPTPTPVFVMPKGIKQCAKGVWQNGTVTDIGVNDTICIYFPAVLPTPPPIATPEPEPEYPPECYDERNEFVADKVANARNDTELMDRHAIARASLMHTVLLQQGYEACGC